jgi:hypothetical protein
MWAVMKLGIIKRMLCIRVNDKTGKMTGIVWCLQNQLMKLGIIYSTNYVKVTDDMGYYRQHDV